VGLPLGNKDVYINVAGGIKIVEPAADVALAIAVASSLMDRGADAELIALGEIGLAGEVRSVTQSDKRLKEAARLGFGKAIMASRGASKNENGIKAVGVASLRNAIDMAFGAPRQE
jgi:DNA repair protein RadA/Sms